MASATADLGDKVNDNMAELNIDGKPIAFSPGESVIQAATRSAIEIPHYCWHPRLSVAANCRMCLVEVEKAPKLVPACQTECKEGMVVHTVSPKVRTAQRQVNEFLLINHPIDCPICDQAGECKLQDYYMRYQLTPSRMREPKSLKAKSVPIGPRVMYNAQRCVMCTRCVRFMEEVPKSRQLGVIGRGDHSTIGTAEGQELDNPYSMNTVDICPVGALTSQAFRFKQRVWNLRRSASICPGCSKGCNTHVDQRSGQVYRMLPRENEQVNKSWLCDEGRLTYNRANVGRIHEALLRDGDFLRGAAPDEAYAAAGALLNPTLAGAGSLVVAMTLHASNEEALAAMQWARSMGAHPTVYVLGYADGEADMLLRQADKNPNRRGIDRVAQSLGVTLGGAAELAQALTAPSARVLVMLGHETDAWPTLLPSTKDLDGVIQVAFARSPLTDQVAHVTLPSTSWVEGDGTWLSGDQRLQRLAQAFVPMGDAQPLIGQLCALSKSVGHTFSIDSTQAAQAALMGPQGAFAGLDLPGLNPLGLSLSETTPLAASA